MKDGESEKNDRELERESRKNTETNEKETEPIPPTPEEKCPVKKKMKSTNLFLLFCILGICSAGVLHQYLLNKSVRHKRYWICSKNQAKIIARNGVLKHLHLVMERIGYVLGSEDDWDLLWTHDYPFGANYWMNLKNLQPGQMVNHFPGTAYFTSKVDLATSNARYVPKAFRLPKKKQEFLRYALENPKTMFVEKNNNHRAVFLKNVSDIDVNNAKKFVQEYIDNPLLVDGHRFDIGVYVVFTSIDPLRVYWYKGDVLFRYCPDKYHPFDPKNVNKYVVRDPYRPTWDVGKLTRLHQTLGYSMKDTFETYIRNEGYNPEIIWEKVFAAITDVFLINEPIMVKALKKLNSSNSNFELVRFDLIADDDLNVYLMEANLSPNLSSEKYVANQLLYEQILYNLFSLVGISSPTVGYRAPDAKEKEWAESMSGTDKNIVTWCDECAADCTVTCEARPACALCKHCMTPEQKRNLLAAHREHYRKGDFGRLFPPNMRQNDPIPNELIEHLTPNNKLQYLWFQGKCNKDPSWCS